ncbi:MULTISPECIES: hypothetical protein [unclassified Saccharopolyspora]|uniref:hypothetical protein n=1 Tax=unclassified Saccharopolyspora TaxID=2646250 RepID=UPI001CD47010|nr:MULTISPECIES: hypothetical protein [unclassified Saccharopolyspora]MCA1186858.1 hypothetical protein [Saccharopolyspora sp. 6T]MCA1193379.1 hypothetical protein [Saccharopolyspora sp. 6V]MCA1228332.1 hypothetical protein [Saccharopolyspora sp. 6M]MCA1282080.1 hypothetical protein [Saccharopolyspora sp. 7B]
MLRLLAALPAVAAVSAACASGEDAPDPLTALATAARSDAALAQGVARSHPSLGAGAGAVAEIRAEHARLLQQEIDRLDPPDEPREHRAPAAQVPASPPEAQAALKQALAAAEQAAAKLCPSLPGYRAGLTGSISASCASLAEVLA